MIMPVLLLIPLAFERKHCYHYACKWIVPFALKLGYLIFSSDKWLKYGPGTCNALSLAFSYLSRLKELP